MTRFFLLLLAVAFASVSCERHEFEETRKLHDHGSHHAGEHDHAHGDSSHGH